MKFQIPKAQKEYVMLLIYNFIINTFSLFLIKIKIKVRNEIKIRVSNLVKYVTWQLLNNRLNY